MTIGNALRFIDRGAYDAMLRKRLNTAPNIAECEKILAEEKLVFSANDFEEAFNHRLTMCHENEEADQIREFKMWWKLLTGRACGETYSGCR